MEKQNQDSIDLSHLQDGNLHLIAFLGDTFCYLVKDPHGSQLVIEEALRDEFPVLVRRMLADKTKNPL